MGSSSSSNALMDKTVVVIGGSYGGNAAAIHLKGKCKLIVIDAKEAMFLSVSSPRAVVEPEFTRKILVPLTDVHGESFRRGKVVQIDPSEKTVNLEDGSTISYDYLVIATGSSNPFPGKITNDTSIQECHALYKDASEKVKAAQRITVIGGGASGVEIAGEIATDFPQKDVTLIHSRDTLLEPAVRPKLRTMVEEQLLDLKVNLVKGEKVLDLSDIPTDLSGGFREVKTDKGTVVPSDLVFICIGMSVNKTVYANSLASSMDERGALRVNSYLQVEGFEEIFAVGDCSTADLQKMANKARLHGESVASNIPLHAEGKAMKPYKSRDYISIRGKKRKMSEESEVKPEQLPPSSECLLVISTSSSSSTSSSPSTSNSSSTEPSTFTTATTASTPTGPVCSEQSSVTSSSNIATSSALTSAEDKPSTSAGLMITRSANIKTEITLEPDSPEDMDNTKSEASSVTKANMVTRTSSRDPSVSTPTMKTRTSNSSGGNGGANPNPAAPSTPTMKTRHSNRVTTPKSLGSTTSLIVGGRAMSTPTTPISSLSPEDSLIKRRSSSRSIKRKKFDDELVESSLVKSSRGGKVPPSPLTLQSTSSTTTQHHSPTPSKPPPPETQSTPKPIPSPPPPPPPQAVKEEVKVEEKKEKVPPKVAEVTPKATPPPPPPPPKKAEVHVPKKLKLEPAVTPKPSRPTPHAPRQSRVETSRSAPEKKKGKAIPSKSSSSKSNRSKKTKSIVPLARETSRWTAEDDLALITAVHQTNDLEQVFQGVKFSHRFSMKEIEERWYALLYDPIASKASQTAMRLLNPDIKIAIMSQALYSEEEDKLVGTVTSSSQPTVDTFQELINKHSTVFNPMRTAKGLHTHWMTMKQYHLLPDQTVQPMPRGDHVLNFSDAEDMMDDSQLQDPRDEVLEHELAAFDRRQKRQIRHLENEIPKWQVLVENVTGMTSQEFDSQTLAVLRGRLVRYLMRSKEITIGRSSKDNTIDVDLSLEGPAWKVSRKQGVIKLRNNGEFYLANEGKRAVHIDGKPVLKGQKWKLTNNSVVEIAGLRFIFLVNQDVINTLRTESSNIK